MAVQSHLPGRLSDPPGRIDGRLLVTFDADAARLAAQNLLHALIGIQGVERKGQGRASTIENQDVQDPPAPVAPQISWSSIPLKGTQ